MRLYAVSWTRPIGAYPAGKSLIQTTNVPTWSRCKRLYLYICILSNTHAERLVVQCVLSRCNKLATGEQSLHMPRTVMLNMVLLPEQVQEVKKSLSRIKASTLR